MGCDSPVRECLAWHVLPHLISGRLNEQGTNARSLCPVHDDRNPSLSISVGDNGKLTWRCFAKCPRSRVRSALIELGVPSGCLPRVVREQEDILDLIRTIVTADSPDHGAARLRVMAALEGFEDLPRGAELDRLAAAAHVHRATAHRARKSPPPQVKGANNGSYTPEEKLVKSRRSEPRSDVA